MTTLNRKQWANAVNGAAIVWRLAGATTRLPTVFLASQLPSYFECGLDTNAYFAYALGDLLGNRGRRAIVINDRLPFAENAAPALILHEACHHLADNAKHTSAAQLKSSLRYVHALALTNDKNFARRAAGDDRVKLPRAEPRSSQAVADLSFTAMAKIVSTRVDALPMNTGHDPKWMRCCTHMARAMANQFPQLDRSPLRFAFMPSEREMIASLRDDFGRQEAFESTLRREPPMAFQTLVATAKAELLEEATRLQSRRLPPTPSKQQSAENLFTAAYPTPDGWLRNRTSTNAQASSTGTTKPSRADEQLRSALRKKFEQEIRRRALRKQAEAETPTQRAIRLGLPIPMR